MCIRDRILNAPIHHFCDSLDPAIVHIFLYTLRRQRLCDQLTHIGKAVKVNPAKIRYQLELFGMMPVSYTHLDVYKRQIQACIPAGIIQTSVEIVLRFGAVHPLLGCVAAVSYTHLLVFILQPVQLYRGRLVVIRSNHEITRNND